jgi:hypothetical protein
VEKESQIQKESQMRVIKVIMSRIKDRARVGELILLWRRRVGENDNSVALTHMKVRSSYCHIHLNDLGYKGADGLVEAIIKKWDFDQWYPLPSGVERRRDGEGGWKVSTVIL